MSDHSMSIGTRYDTCPPGLCLYQSVGEPCVPVADPDPAVAQWREAMTQSTSARLRTVEAELGSALGALAKATDEVQRLRAELRRANDAGLRLIQERDEALDEVERLKEWAGEETKPAVVTEWGLTEAGLL